MAVHCLRMLPKQTDKKIMDRASSIKFKLIPKGDIRGVQTQRSDLASAAELQIYPPHLCSPTITVAYAPKLLIADERIYNALRHAVLQGDSR